MNDKELLSQLQSALQSTKQADKKAALVAAKEAGYDICALNSSKDVMNTYIAEIANDLEAEQVTPKTIAPVVAPNLFEIDYEEYETVSYGYDGEDDDYQFQQWQIEQKQKKPSLPSAIALPLLATQAIMSALQVAIVLLNRLGAKRTGRKSRTGGEWARQAW